MKWHAQSRLSCTRVGDRARRVFPQIGGNVEIVFGNRRSSLEADPARSEWDFTRFASIVDEDLDEAHALLIIQAASEAQARLESVRLRVINRYAVLHDEDSSAKSLLACTEKISIAKAGKDLALARNLATRLPMTYNMLSEGKLNHDRAAQIARATAVLSHEKSLAVDTALHPVASGKIPRQLQTLLRTVISTVDPRGTADRAEKRKAGRRVSVEHVGGEMSWMHAFVASEDALAIEQRLDAIARSIRFGGDGRTLNQLRADALRDLLLGKFSSKVVTHVYVACNVTTLLGLDDLPGQLRGYGPVSAEKVRELAWQLKASWSGVLVDDNGHAQRLAAEKYDPGDLLTELAQLRDQTCRFPVCLRPAQKAALRRQGQNNSPDATTRPCCRSHECEKASGQWAVSSGVDGEDVWTSAITGAGYGNAQEPLVPAVATTIPEQRS
jgi:hypothetical protein